MHGALASRLLVRRAAVTDGACASGKVPAWFYLPSAQMRGGWSCFSAFSPTGVVRPHRPRFTELGYTTPTLIQTQAIPAVLSGGDLLAGARPAPARLPALPCPSCSVCPSTPPAGSAGAPWRARADPHPHPPELAARGGRKNARYARYLKPPMVMFGGVGMNPQIEQLKKRVDILVACPGRLLDHLSQGSLDLNSVETWCLDEADRMLDMGFIHDIKRCWWLPPNGKTCCSRPPSLTEDIRGLADRLLDPPGAGSKSPAQRHRRPRASAIVPRGPRTQARFAVAPDPAK